MSRQKIILLVVVLGLIGVTAAGLLRLRVGQRLGAPGVRTRVVAGSGTVEIALPEAVVGFTSQAVETAAAVTNTLPADTSYGQRVYVAGDGFTAQMAVVLMGSDRSSMHKPQICLPAQGWNIFQTEMAMVTIERPARYELPVIRLVAANQVTVDGQPVEARGIYVYWFVTEGELSADPSGLRRMWRSMVHLLVTGEMQRWAYVSVFAVCEPGREEATYGRMKELIAAAVPEFQMTGGKAGAGR